MACKTIQFFTERCINTRGPVSEPDDFISHGWEGKFSPHWEGNFLASGNMLYTIVSLQDESDLHSFAELKCSIVIVCEPNGTWRIQHQMTPIL